MFFVDLFGGISITSLVSEMENLCDLYSPPVIHKIEQWKPIKVKFSRQNYDNKPHKHRVSVCRHK